MKRLLIILAVLMALLAAALYFLMRTDPGRAFIAARAEPVLAGVLGGEAEIGRLSGALPGEIILEDVALRDEKGDWARIDRARLRWRPLDLVGGAITIYDIVVDGAEIIRMPPSKPDEEEAPDEPFAISLPDGLPELRIGALAINNMRSELGGVSARLDGFGALSMGGRRLEARVGLTSEGDADTVDVAFNIAPDAERIFIDATVAATETGVLAAFANLGGPLFMRAQAYGPPDNAQINLEAQIGGYGRVDAVLLADLLNALELDVDGVFTAGDALGGIPELAEPARFKMTLRDEKDGGAIAIDRLLAAPGELSGDIVWSEGRNVNADLRLSLAEGYRPEITDITGREATLTARLEGRRDDYGLALNLDAEHVSAQIADGATDLRATISGVLNARADETAAGLDLPATLQTRFAVDLQNAASLRALTASVGDGFTAEGDADYRFNDETLRFEGDIVAAPAFVARLAPSMKPAGPIAASLEAEGKADRFTLAADIETPAIAIGENNAPPILAEIALAGLPMRPTGDVTARAKNGKGAFSATVRSSADGTIAAPKLSYKGAGFSLDGSGSFSPEAGSGAIELRYDGADDAEPWPGVVVAGAMTASGDFDRDRKGADLTLSTPSLRVNDFALENFNARADGPPDAVAVTVTATRIAAGTEIKDLSAAATANLSGDPEITMTTLEAAILDNVLRLAEPGVVRLADGVALDNIRLQWGREGRAAIDAAFSQTRWRGDFDLRDMNIPGSDGRASLALTLDTDKETPAQGTFEIRSLIAENANPIDGDAVWEGDALILTSRPNGDGLDMRLSLPVALKKAPGPSVATGGALDGYVKYDGRLEPFAAFLPPQLQTLEGDLVVDMQIAGDTDDPQVSGYAEMSKAAYTELQSGLSLQNLHARADADYAGGASRVSFTGGAAGDDDGGRDAIRIEGTAAVGDDSRLDVDVTLDDAVLSAHPVQRVRANGALKIAGPFDAIETTGKITVEELNVEIVTPPSTGLVPIEVVNIDEQAEEDAPAPVGTASTFDIEIVADDRIFVRGRGIESEWSADVKAVTLRGQPVVLGQMNLRRGTLDFSGRRFEITEGKVAFDRLTVNDPELDIRAEYETDDGTLAAIEITGRATQPSISLSSDPTLPEEDIMALILFGKPSSELTAFESLQTAQALASLGGVGPFGGGGGGLTGTLRNAAGLDMLNIDIDPTTGGGSLEVGKYVADGLFVAAEQDMNGQGGSVVVEYEVTDNITVETELRQDGDQTVSANWKKDF